MPSSLVVLSLVSHLPLFLSQTVTCNGAGTTCACPASGTFPGETCTLNCNQPDVCKEHLLTCRAGVPCIVNCGAKSSCMDMSVIDGSLATDLTVICSHEDSCKDEVQIRCGTGDCNLECSGKAGCENLGLVTVDFAKSWACHGAHCPPVSATFPMAFSPAPTTSPTVPSRAPSTSPTTDPTRDPTSDPTRDPTRDPTADPTRDPTADPTRDPTQEPTTDPTRDPTADPTADPTRDPTSDPTRDPTRDPTSDPTRAPSRSPSRAPTRSPSRSPTRAPTPPTRDPTTDPTRDPTSDPTRDPTRDPTTDPTRFPSVDPTQSPTMEPTVPSYSPSVVPTTSPTPKPTGEAAFLFSMSSQTTMELSIAVSVLLVSICFVCVAVFCLCVVRKHMKPALSTRGTREEMESVISADDIRRRCHDDASAQWEIKIVTDENDHELDHDDDLLETETMTQSEAGPPSPERRRSRNASRTSQRSNRSRKGRSGKAKKGRSGKRGRKGYASVDVEAEVDDREQRGNVGDTLERLEVLNFPSFKSSVSPPSKEPSILNKKINLKDVRPAFYVPGMSSHTSLSSPPTPPQPHQRRLEMVPKVRERDEHLGDECAESVAPSSAVSALSEVTASTHCLQMSEQRRMDTNLSAAWNECAEDAKLCGGDDREISAVSGTSADL